MATAIQGTVAPGFEQVAREFQRNFDERGEVGASFALARAGECLVDLWGGFADPARERAWERDTLQMIFSGTKGVVAICMLALLDEGSVRLEAPVCRYWAEFAVGGKRDVTVAEVLSHRARLPGVEARITAADLGDDQAVAELLAGQGQDQDPRAAAIYHPLTFGWLCGELIRRVTGTSVGEYLRRTLAVPLGLELWIGLPEDLDERVSEISYAPEWELNPLAEGCLDKTDELLQRVWGNPPVFPADRVPWNSQDLRRAEIPGINAVGTARSVASLFSQLASGTGAGPFSARATTVARRSLSCFTEPFTGEPMTYGAGLQLQTELRVLGPPPDAFGHAGAGGSVHAAWPSQGVGVSYAMNQLRYSPSGDPRSRALLAAAHGALVAAASD